MRRLLFMVLIVGGIIGVGLLVAPLFFDPEPVGCKTTVVEATRVANREAHFRALEQVRTCYVEGKRAWYDRHARWANLLFRTSSVIVLLCGAAIPLLNGSPKAWAKQTVSALGLIVALGTAISGFFGWQGNWASYRAAQYELEHAEQLWRLDMLSARLLPDAEAIKAADVATRTLVDRAMAISSKETAGFFERQSESIVDNKATGQ